MADRLIYLFILTEKRRNRLEVGALPKFIYLLYYIARAAHDFQKHERDVYATDCLASVLGYYVGAVCR